MKNGFFLFLAISLIAVSLFAQAKTEVSPRFSRQEGQVRVVLDAGHGGYDFGIISGDVKEKDISLNLTISNGIILTIIQEVQGNFVSNAVDIGCDEIQLH